MSRFGHIRYRTSSRSGELRLQFTVYSLLPGASTMLPTCSAFFRPGTSSTQLHPAMWVSLESSHGRRHWLLLRETEWHLQSIVMSSHVVHMFTIVLLTGYHDMYHVLTTSHVLAPVSTAIQRQICCWVVTPCNLVTVRERFETICCLYASLKWQQTICPKLL